MIYSMTAFARYEVKKIWGNASWEIRSVNQRFLENHFKIPEQFRSLENILREKLRQRLARGKIECSLHIEINKQASSELNLDVELIELIAHSLQRIQQQVPHGTISLMDILRYPGVVENTKQDFDLISQDLLAAFDVLMDDFIGMRVREGEKINLLLQEKLNAILVEADKLKMQMPSLLKWQRDKLQHKFNEIQLKPDPERLEQELVLLAQRTDVIEELDRLTLHAKETLLTLNKGGTIGRKLDFMMQELNRESNTLASKSINADVTNSAIELKVLIEQMREQIQNLE